MILLGEGDVRVICDARAANATPPPSVQVLRLRGSRVRLPCTTLKLNLGSIVLSRTTCHSVSFPDA
ncbi:hypothetical protein FA13DRAFT_229176 [Coprinellus micaceus]|uniref:Uncharacterized protein n=1 Tax=Coprinellus micaceus TaxID=71717 RepID=A0A4Y7TH62_COPMI|nr:hypothetical protein FA13DRAFT_229176 [Coprinellus micaceus]